MVAPASGEIAIRYVDSPGPKLADGSQRLTEVVLRSARTTFQFVGESPESRGEIVVDTGAALTLIARNYWEERKNLIEWVYGLGSFGGGVVPIQHHQFAGVGGGLVDVYFGFVNLRLFCVKGSGALDVRVMAAFEVNSLLRRSLLGLGGAKLSCAEWHSTLVSGRFHLDEDVVTYVRE